MEVGLIGAVMRLPVFILLVVHGSGYYVSLMVIVSSRVLRRIGLRGLLLWIPPALLQLHIVFLVVVVRRFSKPGVHDGVLIGRVATVLGQIVEPSQAKPAAIM